MIKRFIQNKEISDRRLLMVLFLLIYLAVVIAPMFGTPEF